MKFVLRRRLQRRQLWPAALAMTCTLMAGLPLAPQGATAAERPSDARASGTGASNENKCSFSVSPPVAIWNGTITLHATVPGSFGENTGRVTLHDSKKVHDVKTRQGTPLEIRNWAGAEITAVMPSIPPEARDATYVIGVTRSGEKHSCADLNMFPRNSSSNSASPNSSNNVAGTNDIIRLASVPCAFGVSPETSQYWGETITLTTKDVAGNGSFLNSEGKLPGEVKLFNQLEVTSAVPIPGTEWSPDGKKITLRIPLEMRTPGIGYSLSVTRMPTTLDPEPLPCGTSWLKLQLLPFDCKLIGALVTEAYGYVTLSKSGLSSQNIPMALSPEAVSLPRGPIDKTDLKIPTTPVKVNQLTELLKEEDGATVDFGVVAGGAHQPDKREFHTDSGSLTFGSDTLVPTRSITGLMTQPNVVPHPSAIEAAKREWTLAVHAKVTVPNCADFNDIVAKVSLIQTPLVVPSIDVFFTDPDFEGDALVVLESSGLSVKDIFLANQAVPLDIGDVERGIVASSRKDGSPQIRDAVAAVLEWGVLPALNSLAVFDLPGPNHLFPPAEHAAQLKRVAGQLRRAPHWAVDARGLGTLDLAEDEQVPGYMQWNGNSTLSSVFMLGAPGSAGITASGDHKCYLLGCEWFEPPFVEHLAVPSGTLVASLTDFRPQDDGQTFTWPTNTSSAVEPRNKSDSPWWPSEYFDDFFRWLSRE